jgi:geranylgeranyl reductase family protein
MLDAVIVGAGPGGSATAHFLARRGLDVLLVDKFAFPRDKTCGDGLTPRALRVLERMGLLGEVSQMGQPIRGYDVYAPNGRRTGADLTGSQAALVVPRLQLDDLVRERAVQSGARFAEKVSVTHVEPGPSGVRVFADNGETFAARVAVLATGASTKVLLRSGILPRPPKAMLAARAYYRDGHHDDRFELRFDHVPVPGYGWVFPLADGRVNAGVGFLPRRWHRTTARAAFDTFVEKRLPAAVQEGPVRGYPIRVDFLQSPTYAERTLLVGEAAGLVNPLTGEGIDYALESGEIAADHIAAMLSTGDFGRVDQYDQQLRAQFGPVFRFCAQVRDWYCWPPLLNLLVPIANRRPDLRLLLTQVVLGEKRPATSGAAQTTARLLRALARSHQ